MLSAGGRPSYKAAEATTREGLNKKRERIYPMLSMHLYKPKHRVVRQYELRPTNPERH